MNQPIQALKTTVVDVGDKTYTLTALKGRIAYRYMEKLKKAAIEGVELSEDDMVDLICQSLNWKVEKFDLEFSANISSMLKLVEEIIEFNYADVLQEESNI